MDLTITEACSRLCGWCAGDISVVFNTSTHQISWTKAEPHSCYVLSTTSLNHTPLSMATTHKWNISTSSMRLPTSPTVASKTHLLYHCTTLTLADTSHTHNQQQSTLHMADWERSRHKWVQISWVRGLFVMGGFVMGEEGQGIRGLWRCRVSGRRGCEEGISPSRWGNPQLNSNTLLCVVWSLPSPSLPTMSNLPPLYSWPDKWYHYSTPGTIFPHASTTPLKDKYGTQDEVEEIFDPNTSQCTHSHSPWCE